MGCVRLIQYYSKVDRGQLGNKLLALKLRCVTLSSVKSMNESSTDPRQGYHSQVFQFSSLKWGAGPCWVLVSFGEWVHSLSLFYQTEDSSSGACASSWWVIVLVTSSASLEPGLQTGDCQKPLEVEQKGEEGLCVRMRGFQSWTIP